MEIDETLAPYAPRYGRKVYQQHKHTYILSINALNNNENPHGKSNTKCMENTIRSSKNIYIKRKRERESRRTIYTNNELSIKQCKPFKKDYMYTCI